MNYQTIMRKVVMDATYRDVVNIKEEVEQPVEDAATMEEVRL